MHLMKLAALLVSKACFIDKQCFHRRLGANNEACKPPERFEAHSKVQEDQ